jgi:hypothetical protein
MSIPIVGFTGTREGISERQRFLLRDLLQTWLVFNAVHHGGCIGADAAFHRIVLEAAPFAPRHVHPGPEGSRCLIRPDVDMLYANAPYLHRNRDIVDACHLLIACPNTPTEKLRSGTWATVRYARSRHRPTLILYP